MAHLSKDGVYGELAPEIGDVTATSPFMQPEFCLESRDIPVTRKMQRRSASSGSSVQRGAAGGGGGSSIPAISIIPTRPASPGLPKFMRNEDLGEEALYVRVADLPREVQRQVLEGSEDAVLQGVAKPVDQGGSKQQLPLKEPTRLSAQPTDEEIQMSLAQVDLATLMETRPPPPAPPPPPVPIPRRRNPARAEAAARLKALMDRHPLARRAASPAPPRCSHLDNDPHVLLDPYDVSSSSSSDGSDPHAADQAIFDCTSKMQQLLRELSMSKRSTAAATAPATITARLKAATSALPAPIHPPIPPPPPSLEPLVPAASYSSAMADQLRGPNYDEFIDNVRALTVSGPTYRSNASSAPGTRGFGHASDHDDNLSAKGRELARAYQSPVWTHNSGANLNAAEPRRIRYQSNWSGHSEEEYEILQEPQQQPPPMQIPNYHAQDGEPLSSSSDTDSQPGGVAD